MRKSEGNVVDPIPLLRTYGADTIRFWSAAEANLGFDFRYSEKGILNAKNFLSKLWNIARFVSSFEYMQYEPADIIFSDRWILGELSQLVEKCRGGYEKFNFFIPANAIREFTWNLFAAHYIEMVKSRAYNKEESIGYRSAIFALHECLPTILLLLAPICPLITDELWTAIYSPTRKSIQQQWMPELQRKEYNDSRKFTEDLINFNSFVWNKKKETISHETGKPLSLKDSINISVPTDLHLFKDDLINMHNLN